MSDETKKNDEGQEDKEGKGDCLSATAKIIAFMIVVVVMVTRWLA